MPNSHSLHSSNGQKYAQLDFAQVNEKGLKPLIDALNKQGVTVENVDASNRAAKKDGVGVKEAVLRFQDQQQVTVRVNDSGDLIGFKLNGKAIPIQQADTIAKVATSISGAVKQNSQKFTDGLAKKAARVIDTSNTKAAVKSNVQRLKEAKSRRDALSTSVQGLTDTNTRLQSQNASITQNIDKQRTRLSTAQALTVQLKQQLKALEDKNAS
ncbi:odaE [Chimaeribacter californicus]|uniref:OdaE n=1 Tax=Chimaeribacter californicus TaxID=2060067 RepID=A0A2N5DU57_9GAMM|nr:odaE [Chimaeribacter californicus]PLR30291.1 odaE [Chimaeribacter californicus]